MNYKEFFELSKFYIRVSSFEKNRERIKDVPYTSVENLVITYHMIVKTEDSRFVSIMITNYILEELGISKEELHKIAVENSMRMFPVCVEDIKNIVTNISRDKDIRTDVDTSNIRDVILNTLEKERGRSIFVVTNNEKCQGAAAIFYPGVMEQIGECFGMNYFILPSSIHEMIVFADDGKFEAKELKQTVISVNREVVDPDDVLTDDVYYYNNEKHLFKTINIL